MHLCVFPLLGEFGLILVFLCFSLVILVIHVLADGPYYVCDKLICPHRKQRIPGSHPPRFAPLTPREIVENNLQSEARSPIEHVRM